MRLIDADTVKQDIYKYIKEEGRLINPYRMLDYIDSVKTSKKAIPIKWIEEYAKSLVTKRRFLAKNGYRNNRCYDYMLGIIGMLDDWDTEIKEKENGLS